MFPIAGGFGGAHAEDFPRTALRQVYTAENKNTPLSKRLEFR